MENFINVVVQAIKSRAFIEKLESLQYMIKQLDSDIVYEEENKITPLVPLLFIIVPFIILIALLISS